MTDLEALKARLREWPMREQVKTYDHTFHIAETGSSYTTKRAIPQSPKPVMCEAANTIERLEAENAAMREELAQIEVDAMEHYNDWMEHGCEPVEAARFAFDLGQYARAALGDSHE